MHNVIHRDGNNRSDKSLVDYLRLCIPLVKFSASSLASVLLDFVLVLTLARLLNSLLLAVVLARCVSSTFNYLCNQYFVFTGRKNHRKAAPRYFGLVSVNLALNYLILSTIISTGIPLPIAKTATDAGLSVFSYAIQRKVVFAS